jgi:hypothetical protein
MDVVLAGRKIKVMFERRYTSKPIRTLGGVRGDVWSVVKEQDDVRSSAFILALTCTSSRDAQANAVETCRLVDVYQG